MISTRMKAGQQLYHRQAGAGGWGDPLERDSAAVERDVRDGKVSVEAANTEYGVVLDSDSLEVDEEATQSQRAQMRASVRSFNEGEGE